MARNGSQQPGLKKALPARQAGHTKLHEELAGLLDPRNRGTGWLPQGSIVRAELLYVGMNLLAQSSAPTSRRRPQSS